MSTYLISGALVPKAKSVTNKMYLSFCFFSNEKPSKTCRNGKDDADVEDLTLDDDVSDDHEMQLRKKLGIPEADPDALPSTLINKYLSLAIIASLLYKLFFRALFKSLSMVDDKSSIDPKDRHCQANLPGSENQNEVFGGGQG